MTKRLHPFQNKQEVVFLVHTEPVEGCEDGFYIVKPKDNSYRAIWAVVWGIPLKLISTSDTYTITQVDSLFEKVDSELLILRANIRNNKDDIIRLQNEKADISLVESLTEQVIRQKAVDTYAKLLTTYPNPEKGWDVLVLKDENYEDKRSNRYNWNGSEWIDLHMGVYNEQVITDKIFNDFKKELSLIIQKGDNLLSYTLSERGKYLAYTSDPDEWGNDLKYEKIGTLPDNKGAITPYIEVTESSDLYFYTPKASKYFLVEYDENFNYNKKNKYVTLDGETPYKVSSNTKYVIISYGVKYVEDSTINSLYIGYKPINKDINLQSLYLPQYLMNPNNSNNRELLDIIEGYGYIESMKESETVNLFNKEDLLEGYIATTTGAFDSHKNSLCSNLIPVIPNSTYYLYRDGVGSSEVRGVGSDKKTSYKILSENEVELETYSWKREGVFKTNEDTYYVQFNIKLGDKSYNLDTIQLQHGSKKTEYEEYKKADKIPLSYIPKYILNAVDYLNNTEFAKYESKASKNLFDKSELIENYYITTRTGTLSYYKGSIVSKPIEVKPDTDYYLHREGGGSYEVRCLDINQKTPLLPLDLDGNPNKDGQFVIGGASAAFKTPKDAKYVQFTVQFSSPTNLDVLQLEEGSEKTEYEPFGKREVIPLEHLPKEVEDLVIKGNIKTSNSTIIDIQNSEKIGFFSNSFLNGYCMLGKHAINNCSMFSDYIMYNCGRSGDDLLELLDYINKEKSWLGNVKIQDWGIKYGVIAMQDNDGALYSADSETYYINAKNLANAIKAMGGIPILGTEHDHNRYYYNFRRLANEEGYTFMEWGKTASSLYRNVFRPFWHNSHPATRTAWLWSNGMSRYFDTLPRPNKSVKIFRARPFIDTSNLDNLKYDSITTRAERYEELSCGVSRLSEATEQYFDRLDESKASYSSFYDEYQNIQSFIEVNLGDYSLIEFITPYDSNNITNILVSLKASNITNIYVKRIHPLERPLPSARVLAFGITKGAELINKGDSITITGGVFNDNVKGTYTIDGVLNGMLYTTTDSRGKTTSGTDNPTCNIDGVELQGSFDYPMNDYMARYKEPLMEWNEVKYNIVEDYIKIDLSSKIKSIMDFDKFAILIEGKDVLISDVRSIVTGNTIKNVTTKEFIKPIKGMPLLKDNLFNKDSSWLGIDKVKSVEKIVSPTNNTEQFPIGVKDVVELNTGDKLIQKIDISELDKDYYNHDELQLRLIARFFPKYIDTNEKWEETELYRGSFDCAKMKIKIAESETDSNPTVVSEVIVGAYWNEYIINTNYYKGSHLILECSDKRVQLARIELDKIN